VSELKNGAVGKRMVYLYTGLCLAAASPASADWWTSSGTTAHVSYVRANVNGKGLEIGFDVVVCGTARRRNVGYAEVGETYNGREVTVEGLRAIQAVAMAALLSGRAVDVYTNQLPEGASYACQVGELGLK
jgi:hypothetical protein